MTLCKAQSQPITQTVHAETRLLHVRNAFASIGLISIYQNQMDVKK